MARRWNSLGAGVRAALLIALVLVAVSIVGSLILLFLKWVVSGFLILVIVGAFGWVIQGAFRMLFEWWESWTANIEYKDLKRREREMEDE